MKRLLVILLSFIVFTSCGFIHFVSTKENVPKSKEEIDNYLKSQKVDYDYSLLYKFKGLDSLSGINHQIDLYKEKTGSPPSITQLRIYNDSGKLINGYTQCYGPMNFLNILSEKKLKTYGQLPNNLNLRLKNEFKLWDIYQSKISEINKISKEKKYTMVVYWSIWSNYYSKIIFKNIKKYFKKYNMRENVLLILVNIDKHLKNVSVIGS